jgi:hypothetical protein
MDTRLLKRRRAAVLDAAFLAARAKLAKLTPQQRLEIAWSAPGERIDGIVADETLIRLAYWFDCNQ